MKLYTERGEIRRGYHADKMDDDDSRRESIPKSLRPMFKKAKKQGLWFRSYYGNYWFAPADLEEHQAKGYYVWPEDAWVLKDPLKHLASLEARIEEAKRDVNEFQELINTWTDGGNTHFVEKQGNIFDSYAQTLVNPVNCIGVMGAGLAKQFRERFPLLDRRYKELCQSGELRPGRPCLYEAEDVNIILFPTKSHWAENSQLATIEEGMGHVARNYEEWGVKSIAIPALGVGLGKLPWAEVQAILHYYGTERIRVPVEIYAPH